MRYVRGSDNTGTDGRRLSSAAPDGVGRGAPQAASSPIRVPRRV